MTYKAITGTLTIVAIITSTLTSGLVFAEGLADRRGEVWPSASASRMIHDIHQQHGHTAAGKMHGMPSKMGMMKNDHAPTKNQTLNDQQHSEKNQHPKTELLKKKSRGGNY